MYFVADTHAFAWYLIDSPKLSECAREIFTMANSGQATIILPAIVLLELIDMVDKKKINIDIEDTLNKIFISQNFIFAELNWVLLWELRRLKVLKDLHDRAIIATAKLFSAGLISKDLIIKKHYPKTIW